MPADVGMNSQQTETLSMASVVCPHEQHSEPSRWLGGNRDRARGFRMQNDPDQGRRANDSKQP